MIRILAGAAAACLVAAAGTPGGDTCAVAGGEGSCASSPVGDHSLLQVHPAKKSIAAIEKSSAENKSTKGAQAKLQQVKAVKTVKTVKSVQTVKTENTTGLVGNETANKTGLQQVKAVDGKAPGVGEDKAGVLRAPDDYDLESDYPNDMKGTHANTLREMQNATQPGAGDVDRKTELGLKDSWNVDTMFPTDSDGAGHLSQKGMIAWGYPSKVGQDKTVKTVQTVKTENTTGLVGNETGLPANTTGPLGEAAKALKNGTANHDNVTSH
jgi:hypothetical protein